MEIFELLQPPPPVVRQNKLSGNRTKEIHEFMEEYTQYIQVGNYIQPLWEDLQPDAKAGELYNGAVEALTTLLGAALALLLGFTKFNWTIIGDLTLAVISFLDGVVLYLMGTIDTIWVGYAGYLIFRALYQMMITVASFEIASRISETSYGLVFGFNTFLALAFQTLLTYIVADSAGLALPPSTQFQVYGGCFLTLGLVFMVSGVVTMARGGIKTLRKEGVWRGSPPQSVI